EIEQRSAGVATGLYISSNALGGMIGRVMTGYLTDHFSWQTAFFALAVVGIVIVVAVYVMLPKSRFFQPSHLPFDKDMEGFSFNKSYLIARVWSWRCITVFIFGHLDLFTILFTRSTVFSIDCSDFVHVLRLWIWNHRVASRGLVSRSLWVKSCPLVGRVGFFCVACVYYLRC